MNGPVMDQPKQNSKNLRSPDDDSGGTRDENEKKLNIYKKRLKSISAPEGNGATLPRWSREAVFS